MTLAADAREAAQRHPFLLAGLRAGVVNYTAAARFLDVDGDTESVATALRRFADELPARRTERREVRVTMQRGVGPADGGEDPLVAVGDTALAPGDGDLTAMLATGDVDAAALAAALNRLLARDVDIRAAGVVDGSLLVAVAGRDGATALQVLEEALAAVPTW